LSYRGAVARIFPFYLDQLHGADCFSGSPEVCQLHFRIFAREQNAIGAPFERGLDHLLGDFGRAFRTPLSGRYINVDTGPELGLSTCEAFLRALGFTHYVVGREACSSEMLHVCLWAVVQNAVMKIEKLLLGNIGEVGGTYRINVVDHALAGTVLIHYNLQKIRVWRHLRIILFRAVDWIKRIVVPDVPANPHLWFDR